MPDAEIISQFPDGKYFKEFKSRYPAVLRAIDAMAVGFTSFMDHLKNQPASDANHTLFLLFSASWREFEEILVLALNGYGSGAMKLLRALYERTVATQYLMKHPEKVGQFKDFTHVHWHKLLIEADEAGIGDDLPKERREEIESNFANVEKQFTEVTCKPCKKTRLQGSWTKKPVPSQAREIHEQLGDICFEGYLMPTFFLHTTDWGITKQMQRRPDGIRELHNDESEAHYASRAIILAATLMTHLADTTSAFYSVGNPEREAIEEAVGTITKELIGAVGLEDGDEPPAENITSNAKRHYRISELVKLWGIGRDTIHGLVKDDPAVIKIRLGKKGTPTDYTIPASTAQRLLKKLLNP